MKKPKKQPLPEKPQSEMTEQERIDAWRRKRTQAGPIEKPKGKKVDK